MRCAFLFLFEIFIFLFIIITIIIIIIFGVDGGDVGNVFMQNSKTVNQRVSDYVFS